MKEDQQEPEAREHQRKVEDAKRYAGLSMTTTRTRD